MKLLYIHFSLAVTGGIERVLVDKMNYFANRKGFEVFLLTYDQGVHLMPFVLDDRVSHRDLDIRFHQIYNYKSLFQVIKRIQLSLLFEKRIKRAIMEISPDVIIGTEWTLAGSILRNKGKIPYILESHFGYLTIENYEKSNYFKKLYLHMVYRNFSRADAIVCLTKGDANLWKRRQAKNIYIIPNVIHLNEGDISELCDKRAIFVGRFSEEKGISTLLNIWELVQRKHNDWELDMYGEGCMQNYIQEHSNCRNSNLIVHPPTRDIFQEYRKSSILVVTSKFESFGLVILEAMSCGIPVIAFDCPFGPRDIIEDGKNGFLIPERDVNAYVNKLSLLMENRNLRKTMGMNALHTVWQFKMEIIMPKWGELFNILICKN